jgi:hypothetical protein
MGEVIRRVRPTPSDAYLANPHKGCCTFQHFNGDPLFPGIGWSEEGPTSFPPAGRSVAEGYLPSTVAYCRWFWKLMEPEKGKFDFSMIDGALETCGQRGQTLAVRLMPFGSARQPGVPDWYARQFPMEENRHKKAPFPAPVHDHPAYLEHFGGFMREFARRYDGNELLESVDVAYIGPWGEGAADITTETCRNFARLYAQAFVHTPRLALIAGDQMRESVALGSGWRCDCYGDLKGFGGPYVPKHLSWNHHFDCYPQAVALCGAADAWKTGPVHFETCWVPMFWRQQGFDLELILQQGLKFHGTYFMPKYTALPAEWMSRLAEFCRQLGYRFVFRQALYEAQVKRGEQFRFECWIENVGVAPIYRRYELALRLRQDDKEHLIPLGHVDIRKWLPGDACLVEKVLLPAGLRPGWAELSIGLIDPKTKQAKVSFANREMYSDRWLPLEGLEVV